jgi:hypothetical protein
LGVPEFNPQQGAYMSTSGSGPGTSSKAVRLIHAAALAAVLVPLGSVAVETSTITCISTASGGGEFGGCSGTGGYTPGSGTQSNTWKFFNDGLLKYTLEISGVPTSPFELEASDFLTTQGSLEEGGALQNFPGAVCIPTFDEGQCGLFRVFVADGTATWLDGYILTITWFANDDPISQPPNNGSNTILQAHGSSGVFTNPLLNVLYDPAPTPTDPAIGGRGDDFSDFGAFTNVPEPTSVTLLGIGIASLLHRARRRKPNR